MEIKFKEKKQLSEGVTDSIYFALQKTLKRFKDKIREVSVNVKDYNREKPFIAKNLQVFITMKNGEKYYIQKSNPSLITASQIMAESLKDLMSNIINKDASERRKRAPIYLYNRD